MKLITRDTDYAIRAICLIAKRKDEVVAVKDMVKCLNIPKPFLRKILQILNKEGILNSYKGVGGGFTLAVPAGKINIAGLIEIFQGPIKISDHKLKKRMCPDARICVLKKKLDVIEKDVIEKLKSITIKSII